MLITDYTGATASLSESALAVTPNLRNVGCWGLRREEGRRGGRSNRQFIKTLRLPACPELTSNIITGIEVLNNYMEQMEQLIQYFIFNIQFQMSCRFIILNIWKCLNGYSIAIDVFLANLNQMKWTDPGCLWLFLSQWYHNMITISEQNDDSNFYIYMIYPYKKHSPELITSNLFFLFALVRGVRPSACCKYWTFSLELRQILCKILQINTKQLQGLSSGNTRS